MIRPYKIKDKQDLINFWMENSEIDVSEIKFLVNKIGKNSLVCYLSDDGCIKGFVLIQKKESEYELTIVSKGSSEGYKLMKYLVWHTNKDLYVHFKKWHVNIKLLKKFGFRYYSTKQSPTFDLVRKFDRKYYFPKKDLRYEHR